jgi:hypothetical protein
MKQVLVSIFTIATLFASSAARADQVTAPLFQCALTFEAEGGGVQIIAGFFKLSGEGKIRCLDIAGNIEEIPVKVTLKTKPLALNVGIGAFEMAGIATGVGVATGPEALLGKYIVADAQAAIGVGVGANLSVRGGSEALTMNLGVNVTKGLGLQVGVTQMKIEALD